VPEVTRYDKGHRRALDKNLYDIHLISSRPPMATWATSLAEDTGCNLLCCMCSAPKSDEWINWQICWCEPTGQAPCGAEVIQVYQSCSSLTGAEFDKPITLLLQSSASFKPNYLPSEEVKFWWFFICKECRRDFQHDPWYGSRIEGKEVLRANSQGRGPDITAPTLFEENREAFPHNEFINKYYRRGDYWSPPVTPPPTSPPMDPEPLPMDPEQDPWTSSSSSSSKTVRFAIQSESVQCEENPQSGPRDEEPNPESIHSENRARPSEEPQTQTEQLALHRQHQIEAATAVLFGRRRPDANEASSSSAPSQAEGVLEWRAIHRLAVMRHMTPEAWEEIGIDPWQDPIPDDLS
jgi:hypothetical protein